MLHHRLHCHTDSSRLVGFGKGLGGCLSRGLLQLLSKVRRTTLSSALGHHKHEAHCFETLKRGRGKSHGTSYLHRGMLLMQRGTAGIQTPDSPEPAALFKARKVTQESQPCADRESWPPSWAHGCPRACPAEEASWHPWYSAPFPLPRIPGKLLLDETPCPTGRLSVFPNRRASHFPRRCGSPDPDPDPARPPRHGRGQRGQRGTGDAALPRLLCPGCRTRGPNPALLPPPASRGTHPPANRWSSVLGCDMAPPLPPRSRPRRSGSRPPARTERQRKGRAGSYERSPGSSAPMYDRELTRLLWPRHARLFH